MKFKYLLLLASSVWFVGVTASLAAPLRAVNQLTAIRFTPEASVAPETYRNCQTISPAVVTVYAGNETGSGSIVSPEGLIITSNHVVSDRAGGQPIMAQTAGGEQYQGRVVKVDVRNDLALIQLETQARFPTVQLADVSGIQPGQEVCAIGSPYGRPGVLSEGTLSLVRGNGDLQAKIRLYPGNSGGPLLNPQGKMIGVNRAILESPTGKNTGISFATSVQAVRTLLGASTLQTPATGNAHLALNGQRSLVPAPRVNEGAWIVPTAPSAMNSFPAGVDTLRSPANSNSKRLGMTIDVRNLVVQQVQSGSAAAMSGLRSGDRLIAVNGQRLWGFNTLQSFLDRQPDSASFTIARGQQLARVQVRF
ncbi:trypsin-like peptidase domain-containing protein [Leptolyngbya sp. FACHB-321]|uniref:S1C family serine protease n=1 Tax=Leptolyngbya sp. FACHB-321 TaxID=2692807 RepID=UPI0019CD2E44|nr:trypsin-like peptidase domain-containing protein [Leptolyngbya sp. FACHB-321]MBD2035501.1 trypsin-like peptidase domain-containing protein [Leptolyngbya sp. FACHB-321]